MKQPIHTIKPEEYPKRLIEINDPPEQLFIRGNSLPETKKYLCVVGSRKYTNYGKDMCKKIISGLTGSSICIVSGLALGIDAIAHQAALAAGLDCVAVPGSGLDESVLYPRTNLPLAKKILAAGGTLVSEFAPDFKAASWAFPQRNRIMAGLSHSVLVVEATEKSGTLITARLATDYNRDIFTIPGSLKSASSAGPHALIRDGAALIRNSKDILRELNLPVSETESEKRANLSLEEQQIIDLLSEPTKKDELLAKINQPAHEVNVLLSRMELKGLVKESGGKIEKA